MDAIICGIGHTEYSKNAGRSPLQLAVEAGRAAISDAGLTPVDIDGSVTFQLDGNDELAVARNLGIPQLRFSSRTRGGGGGACATVQHAAAAVVSGQARAVLVWRAFKERSRRRFGQPNPRPPDPAWDFYLPFGLDTPAKIYGLSFQRYMHRYGLTNADFGLYAVVRIAATGAANLEGGDEMFNYYHPDLTTFVEGRAMAEDLWAQSGYGPWDMDVAMIYENFSPIVFMQLEAFGYCGPGEARDFIASGGIGPGGPIPVNTNGGLLGEGYIHGMNNIIEAVRQLRGTSPNQVAGANCVLVSAGRSGLILDKP